MTLFQPVLDAFQHQHHLQHERDLRGVRSCWSDIRAVVIYDTSHRQIFAVDAVEAYMALGMVWCAGRCPDGEFAPCRNALRKASVAVKPYLRWDWLACLSRSRVARAPQPAKQRQIRRRPHRVRVMNSFSARRKFSTSVWRPSISTTRKMPDRSRSPKT